MKAAKISSITYVGTEDAVLVVQADHLRTFARTDNTYEIEARQVLEFLQSIFCDFTLKELKKLLPTS